MSIPYTKAELTALPVGAKPERGEFCPKCKGYIPEFADLPPDVAAKLKRMHAGKAMLVIEELTGCPSSWAKSWLTHRDGPHREFGERNAPPCPHCGKQLRTSLARQCVECGADWHDR